LKRLVDGNETELPDDSTVRVEGLPDRLAVRSPDGMDSALAVSIGGDVLISFRGRQYTVTPLRVGAKVRSGAHSGEIHAPMPGLIVDVRIAQGQAVSRGQTLLVLEAMKTQQPFLAPFDGVAAKLAVARGDQVIEGQLLVVITPSE
jgi:acetyl-CoA/propionyl-CoA carboxylase biotin carboxyl carrier protein